MADLLGGKVGNGCEGVSDVEESGGHSWSSKVRNSSCEDGEIQFVESNPIASKRRTMSVGNRVDTLSEDPFRKVLG